MNRKNENKDLWLRQNSCSALTRFIFINLFIYILLQTKKNYFNSVNKYMWYWKVAHSVNHVHRWIRGCCVWHLSSSCITSIHWAHFPLVRRWRKDSIAILRYVCVDRDAHMPESEQQNSLRHLDYANSSHSNCRCPKTHFICVIQ